MYFLLLMCFQGIQNWQMCANYSYVFKECVFYHLCVFKEFVFYHLYVFNECIFYDSFVFNECIFYYNLYVFHQCVFYYLYFFKECILYHLCVFKECIFYYLYVFKEFKTVANVCKLFVFFWGIEINGYCCWKLNSESCEQNSLKGVQEWNCLIHAIKLFQSREEKKTVIKVKKR